MRTLKKISQTLQAAAIFMALNACNSRPPYDILVYDFKSDCNGGITTRFVYDPDPFVKQAIVEQEFREQATIAGISLRVVNNFVYVELGGGKVCKFLNYETSAVACSPEPNSCTGELKLVQRRPGSQTGVCDPAIDPPEGQQPLGACRATSG